ncbi:MAG TPA: hypothetical protein VFA48_02885 [Gammaproteobacteria bacterium]|nr:hypothetical protein [Gammaproteobacteria bacterium]
MDRIVTHARTPIRRARRALVCGVALAALAGTAFAAPPKPVADALAQISASGNKLASGWRYKQTITGTQQSEKLAYDASQPEGRRWTVLSVDGKKPSPEKARELAGQAKQAHGKGRGGSLALGADSWLMTSHYRLVDSSGDRLVYQIEPRPGAHSDAATASMLKHLSGQFVVAKSDHRPVSLTLDNFETFSPRFGVEIKSFQLKILFRRLAAGSQPVVAQKVSTEAKGKVFWIKGFDARTRVVLSDFAPVSSAAKPPVAATH